MNILNLITNKDRVDFSENFNYQTNFKLSPLFPAEKTSKFKVAISRLVDGGSLPVMAQFHALDSEARIGDRTNYKEIEYKKLMIKEKLNQTERIIELLGNNYDNQEAIDFIYDDMSNLTSRVLTRVELANNQVLSTGQLAIQENGFRTVVNYGYPSANNTAFTGWSDATHDIVADLNSIIEGDRKYQAEESYGAHGFSQQEFEGGELVDVEEDDYDDSDMDFDDMLDEE